eukprot:NODE_4973_length_435_cov_51.339378_g4309_i0.p4 GENE.NODE_4973_length_435_cov_51.339378_g4309_i0~~NODE_4973_length_435_cov_51.339378_g4309_i0.p4  ORF type:complete len:55 (-),score=11.26 NODE_4973_length_435_cov_51.339378_g4309_i0:31-195(-)
MWVGQMLGSRAGLRAPNVVLVRGQALVGIADQRFLVVTVVGLGEDRWLLLSIVI